MGIVNRNPSWRGEHIRKKGVEEVEEIPGPRVHLDAALSKKAIETRVENLMIWASV